MEGAGNRCQAQHVLPFMDVVDAAGGITRDDGPGFQLPLELDPNRPPTLSRSLRVRDLIVVAEVLSSFLLGRGVALGDVDVELPEDLRGRWIVARGRAGFPVDVDLLPQDDRVMAVGQRHEMKALLACPAERIVAAVGG